MKTTGISHPADLASDFTAKLDQARSRLPLRRLMERHGKAPSNQNWKSFPKCPYCGHDGSAGVFTARDRNVELFKCFHTTCPTAGKVMDEVDFLQYELNLSRRYAAAAFLKEAGVWEDRERRVAPDEENSLTILPRLKDGSSTPSTSPDSAASETSSPAVVPPAIPGDVANGDIPLPPTTEPATDPAGGNFFDGNGTQRIDERAGARVTEKFMTYLKLQEKRVFTFLDAENCVGFATAKEILPAMIKRGLICEIPDGFQLNPNYLQPEQIHGDSPSGVGDSGEPPETGASPKAPEPSPALTALRWFYERLELSDKDRKELFERRGLVDATIDLFGFRSNPQSNKELLLEMEKHFPAAVLVESGLWKTDDAKITERAKPNAQYYGMRIDERRDANGKKVRDADGEVIRDCVWDEPILIPYFNVEGELVHLRPHKGMMKDKPPQFYVVRPSKEHLETFQKTRKAVQFNVIAEGEFKAAAIWQVIGDMANVGAIPGITMAKFLFSDIEEWLEMNGTDAARAITPVVVGYDNEEKGDPNLPSYQEDEWKRFDSQAWARYLARQLGKQGYDGRVAVLPKSWRDEKGKADWDGHLAAVVREGAIASVTVQRELWERVRGRARKEFLDVIKRALAVAELCQAGFFDKKEERHIKNKLEKISYEPCLPIGNDDEAAIAKRLQRWGMKLKKLDWFPARCTAFLFTLAGNYTAVSGRYYKMKPLSEKQEEQWRKLMDLARERGNEDAKRACELVLRGKSSMNRPGHIPCSVSDFHLRSQYILRRINGSRTRMVTLHNVHGVNTELLALPSQDFGSPVKFRDWLLDNATGGAWNGGQNELTALHEDLGHELASKDVIEVPLRGYHEKSGLWFYEDVCFSDEGEEFLPNAKTGIFWVKCGALTQGYSFARDSSGRPRDREDEVFRQGVPRMYPDRKETVRDGGEFFKDVCNKLLDTLGGFEAYMTLGMIFAAAAGPEIFKSYSAFPGLWVHGAQGEGKSSVVRWLLRIWGFNKEKGLPLPSDERGTLTPAALAGALGQYGELPLWLDEYQPTAPSWVRAILKNSYDRAEGGKKDFGSSPREFLASIVVSGIATSSEPQTKSRFAHIQVSSKNRRANHYEWFQNESNQFHRLGRFLLRHRKAYAASVVAALSEWVHSRAMTGVDDRARMVHGLAYAGFHAACEVFNEEMPLGEYWNWLVEHCKTSAAEVQESVSVDLFWRDVLTANESDAFGTPTERKKYWLAAEDHGAPSLVTPFQMKYGAEHPYTTWKSYKLYFQPGPVIERLQTFKRKSGQDLAIQPNDLKHQMKVMNYWVESKNPKTGHRQRFNGTNKSCWCIAVDRHELGLLKISDEEFKKSLEDPDKPGALFPSPEWMDPRKGDLFGLIQSLQNKSNEGGK